MCRVAEREWGGEEGRESVQGRKGIEIKFHAHMILSK